jgi:hypothetical protein
VIWASSKNNTNGWVMPGIPAIRRLMQEDGEFEAR